MSWFIKFLKCILCVEDDEREVSRNWRKSYEYERLSSSNDAYSRNNLTQNPLIIQSNSSTPKRESIPSNSFASRNVVAKSPSTAMDPCNKIPVVSSQFSAVKQSFATTKANVSSISDKSSEVPSKPNYVISSSSSAAGILQTIQGNRVVYQVTAKPTLSSVSDKSKPTPSQKSSQFFKPTDSPLTTVSDTEKRFSMLKKDPPPPALTHSPKPPPISTKPTLSPLVSSSTNQQKNTNYVWVEKFGSTTYVFPENIKSLIKKGIVPEVLKTPLSPSTYKDYFHALIYAEDCHLEKWEGFEVTNVILELHDATIYPRKRKSKSYSDATRKDRKFLVQFDIDKILERQSLADGKRERRPFLLSRDSVSVKPTGSNIKPFKGAINRVVKSSLILVEFGESFQYQHERECEYDVKFSFNRICLKRAHHAITATPDILYRNFLFPGVAPKQEIPSINLFYRKEGFAVWQILRHQSALPYLVEGPLSIVDMEYLSRTALVIVGAVLQICRKSPSNRVLLCAPLNNTCDELMISLKKEMVESDMFRANAAFREIDGVPENILPSCLYEEESDCFACPSLEELKKYKVISSTFMSSFRLRDEGMKAGHFSHIFLVDASSVTEPEAMVPLANFANSETIVVVTGAPRNRSSWVRSSIARQNGLMTSYFERLRESKLYKNLDPRVIMQLESSQNLKESSKSLSQFLDRISLF